jgi:hypothetical protein
MEEKQYDIMMLRNFKIIVKILIIGGISRNDQVQDVC